MNATNRALNRTLIAATGLVLLALGLGAIALSAISGLQPTAEATASDLRSTAGGWLGATPIGNGDSSWLLIALVALGAIIVIGLAVFVFKQGRGHTSTLIAQPDDLAGSILVDTKLAQQAIQDAMSNRPELVTSHVSSYTVRGTPMLKIAATARRGVSPREVTRIVDEALLGLDAVLGVEIPALVHISGGFRARTASATRVG